MLILSDIHYPIGNLRTIRKIIEREKPSTLVLLGDNIELSMFNDHFKAYHEFFSGLDSIFPIKRSIIMLGDNDYQYASDFRVSEVVKSYSPINFRGYGFKFFSIGNMNFFHGNLEKNEFIEKIGYIYVKTVNRINYEIAPKMLAIMSRLYFGVKNSDYMFLGHLHYLGISKNNVFCGTLNHKFMPFPNSLGYVTLRHKNFNVVPGSIKITHLTLNKPA